MRAAANSLSPVSITSFVTPFARSRSTARPGIGFELVADENVTSIPIIHHHVGYGARQKHIAHDRSVFHVKTRRCRPR